uniref:Ankyrin and armadillo repeat-containing protein n=1 Tax=Ciona savignyi TaxID=51511 RepID=H2ZMU6_CIOSA
MGLISNLTLSQSQHLTLLFPKEQGVQELEYRELHQIVRELTTGIFALNQMPWICFESNFDLSSSCQMPMVYKDTRVGQVLLAVDYAMKSFWHGVTIPSSKRSKLAERWRILLDVNPATGEVNLAKNPYTEFATAGQECVTDNPELQDIYEELNNVDPNKKSAERENKFFNSYAEYVRCVMSLHVSKVKCCTSENVVAFDVGYDVSSAISLYDDDQIPPIHMQRLRRRLRHQIKVIEKGLLSDSTTRRNISLLKFITATSLILVALRRRLMRVPDVDGLLHPFQGDGLRTESELPPFAFNNKGSQPCNTFTVDGQGKPKLLSHVHGEIQFDTDTDHIENIQDEKWCHETQVNAGAHLEQVLKQRLRLDYAVPVTHFDGKKHYVVHIPLTTYYPASPPIPTWLHARYQHLSTLRSKKLSMNDIQLAELFKKIFGFRKALANKSIDASMRLCACRGLLAPLITLMKKIASSSLFAPDVLGMTLMHYCCIFNKSTVLSLLLSQKPNLNMRRTEINVKSTRATALHLSARCGSLACLNAMLASRANPNLSDSRGRSAVHHAAGFDQIAALRCLLRKPNLLEQAATGSDNATPLLVAASSGSLGTLKFLIEQGASVMARDVAGDGPVERATLNFHSDVLIYFIEINIGTLQVWNIIVEMLKSSIERQDAALRCLEVLLHQTPSYWQPIIDAGAIPPLVALLSSPIRSLACSVICLMSEHDLVRKEIAETNAIPGLFMIFGDERCELQSRSSVVLSDLANVNENAARIAEHGGIRPLVDLLQTDVIDVVVNAINTLAALCRGDCTGGGDIQHLIMECGAVYSLVDFLSVRDDALQTATSDAIAAICYRNPANQDEFVRLGVLPNLVTILRGHCIPAQIKAALAVDCITFENSQAQHAASIENAADALCRLFHIWSDTVKERGACALWALAGSHPEQQRAVALQIGTKQMMEMLISKSETLQYLGCQGVAAISRNSLGGQNLLVEDGIVAALVRLLRLDHTTRKVVMAVMHAINNMCVGIAHLNNKRSQELIAEEGAIELLMDKVWQTSRDETMQVDLVHCLACLVTGCTENEDKLNELGSFGFEILLQLLHSPHTLIQYRVMAALLFAFNRLPQQQRILKLGGIPLSIFNHLLDSPDLEIKAGAAFQLVVLARVVSLTTVVDASARGIIELVQLLDSGDVDIIIRAADYMASLAHTRAGVPDAIVTSGAVAKLLQYLDSSNDQLRQAVSQALGYLSFNRTASRELMAACRGTEGVYQSLIDNLGNDGRIAEEFVAEFKRQSTVGLP